jgi:hypothetical protein
MTPMLKTDHDSSLAQHPKAVWPNPWRWMLIALAATGAAFIWTRMPGKTQEQLDIVHLGLLLFGLLAAGVAVWMRCACPRTIGLDSLASAARGRVLVLLAFVHGAVALAVGIWVVMKLGSAGSEYPGDVGGTLLLFLLTVPWCTWSAYHLTQRASTKTPLGERFETAVLVTQAGLAALMASWALFWGPGPKYQYAWDSLRLFLSVLAAVAFMAAPLVAASSPIRRLGVSVLILVHFAAITSAVLSNPPGPWVAMQAQHWIFRPYLAFMYLNNAYRFYSPEPGPANQLWFRIEYKQGDTTLSRWMKLPDIDDEGGNSYETSVQYIRRLAMTDSVSRALPMPWTIPNSRGEMQLAEFVEARQQQMPNPLEKPLGFKKPAKSLDVPMHPTMMINYQRPTPEGLEILSSFARFVLRQPHPKYPDAAPATVKIYRVQHLILAAESYAHGADPHDWVNYLPYYMGMYNPEGALLDSKDPFLYWLLPILREDTRDPGSRLNCYIFKHAGDDEWQFKSRPSW